MGGTRQTFNLAALVAIVTVAGACASEASTASPAAISATVLAPAIAPSGAPRSPEASAEAAVTTFEDIEPGTGLRPGDHVLHYASIGGADRYPSLAFTFTVPSGWNRVELDGVVWNDDRARLRFIVPDNVYADPCDPAQGLREPAIGPTVADLSAALTEVPAWTVESRTAGTFHGFPGERLQVRGPADVLACYAGDPPGPRLMHGPGIEGFVVATSNGERHDLRVLDVDGTRVVVDAVAEGVAPASATAELEAIVDSITIQP